MPFGRQRNPALRSEQRQCPTCGTLTEHRQVNAVGGSGKPLIRWRCASCQNRRAKEYRERRKQQANESAANRDPVDVRRGADTYH